LLSIPIDLECDASAPMLCLTSMMFKPVMQRVTLFAMTRPLATSSRHQKAGHRPRTVTSIGFVCIVGAAPIAMASATKPARLPIAGVADHYNCVSHTHADQRVITMRGGLRATLSLPAECLSERKSEPRSRRSTASRYLTCQRAYIVRDVRVRHPAGLLRSQEQFVVAGPRLLRGERCVPAGGNFLVPPAGLRCSCKALPFSK
jgi:hypothetical protein